jgi:hypothetical protein
LHVCVYDVIMMKTESHMYLSLCVYFKAATFGPFDRQVVILNTDGRTFTLLENPQAMRLKKAGFIEGRKFVKQPTEADIEAALVPDGPGLADAILSIFGRSEE